MKNIVTIILAGGRSTRFWPLTDKNLLNFTDSNLLEYHLNTLGASGVKDFIVVCSPDVAAFLRVKSKFYNSVTIHRVLQDNSNHGIGKAVLLTSQIIKEKYNGRPVYIINNDDLYEASLHQKLYGSWQKNKSKISLAGFETDFYKPLGYFSLENDKITGITEKPGMKNLPSHFANMSLHLYSDFSLIEKALKEEQNSDDKRDDLYERALNRLCCEQEVSFVKYNGRWEILKYPWDILGVANYFLTKIKNKISEKAQIDKTARIEGPVIIEEGVRVLEHAKISGPAVIKKETIIGTGSLVRESIIGNNCIIGYNTEITRSYIGQNCWFHTNYIGDSVIGNNVNMGSGGVIANLRLDQQDIFTVVNKEKVNSQRSKFGAIIGNNVQVGVNASIMPGIKIGKNSVVGPAVLLKEDLDDNVMVYLMQSLVKKGSNVLDISSSRKHFRQLLKM